MPDVAAAPPQHSLAASNNTLNNPATEDFDATKGGGHLYSESQGISAAEFSISELPATPWPLFGLPSFSDNSFLLSADADIWPDSSFNVGFFDTGEYYLLPDSSGVNSTRKHP